MIFSQKKAFITFLSIIIVLQSYGAFEPKGCGTVFIGNGSSGIADERNAFMVFINPAGTGLRHINSVHIFYRNFYQIPGLNQVALSSDFNLLNVPLAVGVNRYGNNLYAETELRLASSMQIIDSLRLGFSLNWFHLAIERYGNTNALGFDLAAYYRINEKLASAFVLSNISEPGLSGGSEKIPACLILGFSYQPFSEAVLNFDIVKEDGFSFDYRVGIGYELVDWFQMMFGYKNTADSFSGGLRIKRAGFLIGYSAEYHTILGLSHSLGVGYAFD